MTHGRQPKQLNKTGGEAELVQREAGLQHQLSAAQVAMIALGSTIGTGLFLTSAISVKLAGPAVILSFAAGALITLTVMWALAEMAVEHPAAGSFGLYAEMYLGPWAGFVARYTYWLCLVIIVGSEVAAADRGGTVSHHAGGGRRGPDRLSGWLRVVAAATRRMLG